MGANGCWVPPCKAPTGAWHPAGSGSGLQNALLGSRGAPPPALAGLGHHGHAARAVERPRSPLGGCGGGGGFVPKDPTGFVTRPVPKTLGATLRGGRGPAPRHIPGLHLTPRGETSTPLPRSEGHRGGLDVAPHPALRGGPWLPGGRGVRGWGSPGLSRHCPHGGGTSASASAPPRCPLRGSRVSQEWFLRVPTVCPTAPVSPLS